MAYVLLTDIRGKIPASFLTQALDDDQDGVIDAGLWDLLAGQAGDEIDSRLGQRYAVPLADPLPAAVRTAAVIFAAEAIYARRVAPDANPWTKQADAMRTKLDNIGKGLEPLTPKLQRADPSGSIVATPSRTAGRGTAI